MAYTFKHGDRPIDGYTIQRAVGRGGFGEVYYAISDGGREVALKYLRDNPQVELRGVSNCINLKSPYLVAIFDVRKTVDDEYAIIMEYCSGPSLRDLLIAEPKGFEPQKAVFFLREIAKGLAYLHDRGIVHRDLKPGNIFYDDGYVKIGDYGLSKFMSVSRHSGQTASVGTVHYMAPEIGSGNYSKGVDIYAMGVMLYEMLLGKVPFEGSSLAEVLMKHLTTQPELDELPHPFANVIRKALEKDPKDRYQSVDEMVDDLLEVETVRESLAGFSVKSLDGAVRRGTPERFDSPVPSPNPPPSPPIMNFGAPPPPYAQPVAPGAVDPHAAMPPLTSKRLTKRMNQVSKKLEAKMAKLAGGRAGRRAKRGRAARALANAVPSLPMADVALGIAGRKKRIAFTCMLSVALAVGLGILVGNTYARPHIAEQMGAAAGMLVLSMSGGIALSFRVRRWFGFTDGPRWTKWMVSAFCCAPLLAIGAAPAFEAGTGLQLWLGLLALAMFGNWQAVCEESLEGEISFGTTIKHAMGGLILVAVASAITDTDPEHFILIGAGVAGAVSLIIQATSWWLPAHADRALSDGGETANPEPEGDVDYAATQSLPQPTGDVQQAAVDTARTAAMAAAPSAVTTVQQVSGSAYPPSNARWGVTRAFWGLLSFVMMGGMIVAFLTAVISENLDSTDLTIAVGLCAGLASFLLFTLRKTTAVKREGVWRETIRPLLISASLASIGGSIAAISIKWSSYLGDEERIGLVSGLVFSSILFLALVAFGSRKQTRTTQPFLQGDVGGGAAPAAADAGMNPSSSDPLA